MDPIHQGRKRAAIPLSQYHYEEHKAADVGDESHNAKQNKLVDVPRVRRSPDLLENPRLERK